MQRSSYNAACADIRVKINGTWQAASPLLRDIYIGYKSLPMSSGSRPYSKDGITIFRTDNDAYMPTFYRWDDRGHADTTTTTTINEYVFPENEEEFESFFIKNESSKSIYKGHRRTSKHKYLVFRESLPEKKKVW